MKQVKFSVQDNRQEKFEFTKEQLEAIYILFDQNQSVYLVSGAFNLPEYVGHHLMTCFFINKENINAFVKSCSTLYIDREN